MLKLFYLQELCPPLGAEEASLRPRESAYRLPGKPRPSDAALQVGGLQRGDLAGDQSQGRAEELPAALRDPAVGPGGVFDN